ncbi:MAG: hypothetical protein COW70_07730 [Hydrogenophilales bacterium CG18_big_fil_WC_8_21_14_2_50_58_12]|nr:MAG: hypothetical protein COW70_07730 [Hydrogenophilales bacterium CG18_big_fil_WC_8_21_14_2_50_58_12]
MVIGHIRRFIYWWSGAFIRLIGREAMQIGSNTKIDIRRNALRLLTPYALRGFAFKGGKMR